jgi:hypothetical protein
MLRACAFTFVCLATGAASAHTFGTVYNLPVPFSMYAYGAAAALGVSFLIVAYFATVPAAGSAAHDGEIGRQRSVGRVHPAWLVALRILSTAALLLTIVAGFIGARNAYASINMTLFWVIFVLGCFYVVALAGDLYALANPWRVLCDVLERVAPRMFRPRRPYPRALAYYPALILYIAFIWIELFANTQPRSLSVVLLVYTAINLAGAAWVGKEAWFRYGEFFDVMFRLAGKIAPFEYLRDEGNPGVYRVRMRKPFIGLIEDSAEHASLLLFVLFMLSSTAFDGIHDTLPWVTVFWKNIYPILAGMINRPYVFFVDFYYQWQWSMLVVSPFVYLAVYLFFIWLAKVTAGSATPVWTLALRFAFSLVPIAFVYNVTHYYTLLVSQGANIVRLVSDPFGLGWDLFGTAQWLSTPIILDAGGVWHTQVGLILFGHIVAVYLAHVEALRCFPGTRRAIASQLPMLLLMVLLTTAGLWILSLPIAAGQVVQPTPATG